MKNQPPAYRPQAILYLLLVLVSIVMFGLVLIYQTQFVNRSVGLKNQTYQRIGLCIFSVPYNERTDGYIISCYDKAEKATGVKVERYGSAAR